MTDNIAHMKSPLLDTKNYSIKNLKKLIEDKKSELITNICNKKVKGLDAAYGYSDFFDKILTTIFNQHFSEQILSEIAILPIGGYGRGVLAPYSDIDLLFIVKIENQKIQEEIQKTLYDIWDLKLVIGYSIHTIPDAIDKLKQDTDFCTACLERRFLFGAKTLFKRFSSQYVTHQNDTKMAFMNAKMSERLIRHKKNGDSRYLVEPDIKNGKGGLRDLQTLYWTGKYLYNFNKIKDFPKYNIFSEQDMRIIEKAEQFLWSVRFMMHHVAGRGHEKLNFDIQKEISILLGYKDKTGRLAVEQFMKHYFIVARTIGHITRIFCNALEVQHRMASRKIVSYLQDAWGSYKLNIKNYQIVNNRIDFISDQTVKENPILMVEIFQIADKQNISFHPNALKRIRKFLYLISGTFLKTHEPFHIFRNILCHGQNTEKTLRDMNEAGVLGRLIPDFGRIVAIMQFNMYHHYTVDEHLIQTVGVMHDIEKGKFSKDHPLSSDIVTDIDMHDALYLAVFLHDMAKGRPEDHSIAGAEIASELAPKMGFSEKETDMIEWLVLHHLAMSDISQKRDLSDPNVLIDFSKFIQSTERLKLLLCLTVADIRAVGPGVWNGWKGELLRTLYYGTLNILSGGISHHSIRQNIKNHKEKFIETLNPSEKTDSVFSHIMDILPDHFWVRTDIPSQKKMTQLIYQDYQSEDVCRIEAFPDSFCDVTEIIISTKDYPGLFAALTGALSSSGVHIYDARIFTTKDKYVIDQFRIQDISCKAITDESYLKRIKKNINKAILEKKTDFHKKRKIQSPICYSTEGVFEVPTSITIDNKLSSSYTIIEIETLNRPFLLHDISCRFKDMHISITSAHINSFGEKAIDVFYVKDRFGFKITDSHFIQKLKTRIHAICD